VSAGARNALRIPGARDTEEIPMLWTIFVILVVLWLLGFSFHIAGGLIHLLIVAAVIVLIFNLLGGGRRLGW
jgi:hypothetical protein